MNNPKYKVVIYQHVPKCGGRSFIHACRSYFNIEHDSPPPYPSKEQIAEFSRSKMELAQLPAPTLLHGHLVFEGIRPAERYREELRSPDVALMTIVRDPLERALSAFFHRRKRGKEWEEGIEDWLGKRKNNICRFLGIEMIGEQPSADPFLLIGVTEQLQDSLDVFARLTGMPPAKMERLNESPRDEVKLAPELLETFRKKNAMDYALHAYARGKLREQLQQP